MGLDGWLMDDSHSSPVFCSDAQMLGIPIRIANTQVLLYAIPGLLICYCASHPQPTDLKATDEPHRIERLLRCCNSLCAAKQLRWTLDETGRLHRGGWDGVHHITRGCCGDLGVSRISCNDSRRDRCCDRLVPQCVIPILTVLRDPGLVARRPMGS